VAGFLDTYLTHFKVYTAVQLQYRVALVIWLIGMVLEPVIYLVIWSTVAQAGGGQVGGYSGADFAAYFIVMMLVNHFTFSWVMHDFEFRIRRGEFSPRLLRPLHPIHSDVADNVTYKLLTAPVMIPAAVILALTFHPRWELTPASVAIFVPSLLLGFAVRFLCEWALALAAFWTTRVNSINQVYFVGLLFLSGRMAPLSLFPTPVQAIAAASPFRWMMAFPVEVLLGRLSPADVLNGLVAQVVWVGLSLLVMSAVWRVGIKRYTAVGA
jgi:ABC-2 type transport system permease protein